MEQKNGAESYLTKTKKLVIIKKLITFVLQKHRLFRDLLIERIRTLPAHNGLYYFFTTQENISRTWEVNSKSFLEINSGSSGSLADIIVYTNNDGVFVGFKTPTIESKDFEKFIEYLSS
jgi:hypothetical protein